MTNQSNKPHVLLVDDEPNVTSGLRLFLRKNFIVSCSDSGASGLEALAEHPDTAVIVSDMRMPGMSGAEFLAQSIEAAPDASRILLTGQTDLEGAIAAVNHGKIFRFLTKPCERDVFVGTIEEGVRQFQALRAEEDLLDRTLRGSVQMLTEVLGIVQPTSARFTSQVLDVIRQTCTELGLPLDWRIEMAAMLSQIGCVTLPESLVKMAHSNLPLSEEDQQALGDRFSIAGQLIEAVPRLETVADSIVQSARPPTGGLPEGHPKEWPMELLCSELLRLAHAYLEELASSSSEQEAKMTLARSANFSPGLLRGIARVRTSTTGTAEAVVSGSELKVGMTLLEPVISARGVVLAPDGATATATLVRLAANYSQRGELVEPIRVLAPASEHQSQNKTDAA